MSIECVAMCAKDQVDSTHAREKICVCASKNWHIGLFNTFANGVTYEYVHIRDDVTNSHDTAHTTNYPNYTILHILISSNSHPNHP